MSYYNICHPDPSAAVSVTTNAAVEKMVTVDLVYMVSLQTEIIYSDSLKNRKSEEYLEYSRSILSLIEPAATYVSAMNDVSTETKMISFVKQSRQKRDSDLFRIGLD